jgi:hypothetical protein
MLRKRTLTAERQKSADVADDIDQSLPFSTRLLRWEKIENAPPGKAGALIVANAFMFAVIHQSYNFKYCWIYAFNVVLEVGGANGD